MTKFSVPVTDKLSAETFKDYAYSKRTPMVLKGLDVGPCKEKWTAAYLADAIGKEEVKIHVSESPLMDFLNRNFLYRSLPFDEFVRRASQNVHDKFFLSETELYYLRSLGGNARKEPADIRKQFPQLAHDIRFPDCIHQEQFFSSVLRIASAGLTLWTHYDIMDNFLIQVQGKKRVIFFHPEDLNKLYLNGDKSEVLDVDNPDLNKYPAFAEAVQYECFLEPGDILFIPALWFHNVTSLEFSVAVNMFWRNLEASLYDKKDPYGNKDLLPAVQAFTLLDKALKNIEVLPNEYRRFYAQQMVSHIMNKMLAKN